jgi:hypothetical protein
LVLNYNGGYDTHRGFVIRAEDAVQAVIVADKNASRDSYQDWLDPNQTTCVEVVTQGDAGVILAAFDAG